LATFFPLVTDTSKVSQCFSAMSNICRKPYLWPVL
jgi:hypothetical protein